MFRRAVVAAATLSLIACASSAENTTAGSTDDLNAAASAVPVRVLRQDGTRKTTHGESALVNLVRNNIDLSAYREARIEDVTSSDGSEHLVVQLLVTGQHAVKLARIDVDAALNVQHITSKYSRAAEDELAATATTPTYACPDETVQFIALCPNDDALEIATTNDVAAAAKAAGLKTVTLLKSAATHDAYLDYMKCPKLVGNFYDGDSNPDEMVTYDGEITAREIAASEQWNLAATTIWVACEAYNDPMLSAVQKTAKAQKYAAGINDLAVGPSDKAAACAMKAAIAGKPETSSFDDCYDQLNETSDKWGFGGDGADTFATLPPATSSGN